MSGRAALVALALVAGGVPARERQSAPPVVLWAWERREDLGFVDPARVAVAALAGTVRLVDDEVGVRPRRQPLAVPVGTRVTPVVRVEMDRQRPPVLSARQRTDSSNAIRALVAGWQADALQVDFDAPRSARPFYRALLGDLRARLPPATRLSITALASWCADDDWLDGLPVDEVVPMLFRMGSGGNAIRARGALPSPHCRTALGLAVDEPALPVGQGQRLYVFDPKPWSVDGYARALTLARGIGP